MKADHEQGGEAAAGLQAWKGNGAAHGCQAPRAGTTRTTITFEIPARFVVPTIRAMGQGFQRTPRRRTYRTDLFEKIGAGERIRTVDPNLGKVMLYP